LEFEILNLLCDDFLPQIPKLFIRNFSAADRGFRPGERGLDELYHICQFLQLTFLFRQCVFEPITSIKIIWRKAINAYLLSFSGRIPRNFVFAQLKP
jgi:hypothetical protein